MKLAFERGGEGMRLLVLLHGLGATRQVWRPMLELATRHWNGSWMAPDLRGHGESAPGDDYSLSAHATDVGEMVAAAGRWGDIVILGHSMGGAIALALASGSFGINPSRIFGLGIKVEWTPDELAKLRDFAKSAPRTFPTRGEAIQRYLKVSGLNGLIGTDSEIAESGVKPEGEKWRLAASPVTSSVGAPPMADLIAKAKCAFHLGRGATDGLVTAQQLRRFDPRAEDIAAAGHNAMVEDPQAVWAWLDRLMA